MAETSLGYPQTILPPSMPSQKGRTGRSSEEMAVTRAAQAQKREQEALYRELNTEEVDGYTLMPAIGFTGSAENLGWEVHPPKGSGPVWYLKDHRAALEAIPRHRARYARG